VHVPVSISAMYKRTAYLSLIAVVLFVYSIISVLYQTRMWADAQHDGRPAECRWRPLLNAAKFG